MMKDINTLKNYRLKYKRYYNIDFGRDFEIHHIDLNRENNDISNLLLLPKKLHAQYHLVLNVLSVCPDKPKADGFIDVRLSNETISHYEFVMFEKLPSIISECQKWMEFKRYKYDKSIENFIFGR